MGKGKKQSTTNTTLIKLKDTPYANAKELNENKKRILTREWENIETARVRTVLFEKEENHPVIAPFINGFRAKFIGENDTENLIRVYLTEDKAVQVDIDGKAKTDDTVDEVESLVKALTESFMKGYLTALGLKDEAVLKGLESKKTKR